MTRQENITLQQVYAKIENAKNRSLNNMERAIRATSPEVYEARLRDACKAADDYNTWKIVLKSIKPNG